MTIPSWSQGNFIRDHVGFQKMGQAYWIFILLQELERKLCIRLVSIFEFHYLIQATDINGSVTVLGRSRWHPTPVLLPGKSHGWRSLVGFSPWGHKEPDMTEWLHFYFSLSCTGEGNGNPLQCSCLENPRDGRAWWAAIYGVAQSRTRLKWLSSSSNSSGARPPRFEFRSFSRSGT